MKQRVLVIGANHLECERLVKILRGNAEVESVFHVQTSNGAVRKFKYLQPHVVILLHFHERMVNKVFRFCPEASVWLKASNVPEWITKGLSEGKMPVLTKEHWETRTNIAEVAVAVA